MKTVSLQKSNSHQNSAEESKTSPNKVEVHFNVPDNGNCTTSQKYKKYTPDKKNQFRFQGIFNSPLQTIHEKTKGKDIQWISTPTRKNVTMPSSNPFDVEVDSLSMSSFSPSVFTVTRKKSQEGVSFRWSIEQLATLDPADIDETSQQVLWVDSEKEVKAQKAIDSFFAKNHIAPSPWTPTVKCMSFSPRITSSGNRPRVDVRKIRQISTSLEASMSAKEVSTQTMVSIPPNLDLMRLLGNFCTYHEEEGPSFSSSSSYNDADMLSTSSLRRKLFINEDKLESPALIKGQTNNDFGRCGTPEIKALRVYPTPSSDHFSSSPITPRNWSLSPNQMSLSSPNISPICIKSRKKPSPVPRLKMLQEDIEQDGVSKIDDQLMCVSSEMISEIETESSCNTTWNMSKPANIIQQEGSDLPSFPNPYTESSSNQRDTGYLTGSLNSMMSQQTSSYMQFRATPVAELLEDCAITKFGQQCLQQQDVNDGSHCVKAIDDSSMMMSFCCDQSSSNALKNVPWNPSGFSTPTKGS